MKKIKELVTTKLKSLFNEEMHFKVEKEHFFDDVLEYLVIAIEPEYREKYFECNSKEEFVAISSETLRRNKLIQNRSMVQEKRANYLEVLNNNFNSLFIMLADEDISIEELIEQEEVLEIKALLKWVQLVLKEFYEDIKIRKVDETDILLGKLTSNRENFINYIIMFYLKDHMAEFKLPKTKEKLVLEAAKNYSMLYGYYQSTLYLRKKSAALETDNNNYIKEITKKDKVIETKKNEITVLNEKMKENLSSKEHKEKKPSNKELESLQARIEKERGRCLEVTEENTLLRSKIEEIKRSTVAKADYDKANKELNDAREEIEQLSKKLEEEESDRRSFMKYNLFDELEIYLQKNGMTDELLLVMKKYENFQVEKKMDISSNHVENTLGYCKIEEDGHYIIDVKGDRKKIVGLTEDMYLGETQFVMVDNMGNLTERFRSRYTIENASNIDSFAIVEEDEDGLKITTNYEDYFECRNLTGSELKKGYVVGLNCNREVVKLYKHIKFNADFFLNSALIRNQDLYLIERHVDKHYVVKDIADGQIKLIEKTFAEDLETYSIVFLKEERIIKILEDSRFYTSAACYENYEFVPVVIAEDRIFVDRQSGERRILGKLPEGVELQSGDVIKVDEYSNFIERKIEEEVSIYAPEKSSYYKRSRETENGDSDNGVISIRPEKVLIIGDEGMNQSYKLQLLKSGYRAEVVSGIDSWNRIEKAVRQSDVVVFVTECAKHKNYYKLKAEFSTKKILYAAFEGPGRIAELLNEALGEDECMEMVAEK